MLVRFAASNIRSIHERQELSLVPSAFYKDREEVLIPCREVPTGYLLPSAIIYGPNASGKSNVVNSVWPAPGSEDTELGVLMEPEVGHGETEVYAGVQA